MTPLITPRTSCTELYSFNLLPSSLPLRRVKGLRLLGCRWLATQATTRHAENVAIEGEAGIDQGNENGENVAHVDGPAMVLLRDFQGWCGDDLLPT